jgi:hypothetical protein
MGQGARVGRSSPAVPRRLRRRYLEAGSAPRHKELNVEAASSSVKADRLGSFVAFIPRLQPTASWGGVATSEIRASTPVLADDGGVFTS